LVGITSVGTYIPVYRLSRDEIARAWEAPSLGGEKAVAGYDEDSVTMAVAAALDCLKQGDEQVDALFFATTTSPWKEKQAASVIATAIDLPRQARTADFSDSLRGASTAMNLAVDSIKSGSAKSILITVADCRMAAAQSKLEQQIGDAAAAVVIGDKDVIVSFEGSYSVFNEFTDMWRTDEDKLMRSGEDRFSYAAGYLPIMRETITGLMQKYGLTPKDFSKLVCYAPDARTHTTLARSLGFDPKSQLQDPLLTIVGNAGAAGPLLMLVAALEEAEPDDKILFASYGDGSDAFILRVTEDIRKLRDKPKMKDRLATKMPLSYERYVKWRNLLPVEGVRLQASKPPSIPALWRERRSVLSLYGVKCRQCGTPQYPPTRICAVCQAKDDFDDYKFSDKRGQVFTYAVDQLAPVPDPPGISAVIDFDDGGRILCDVADCDPREMKIGLPVEMTFRRLRQSGGIISYFWEAKPIIF
jgi:hydroxymethylglutaryl-CoA synthase